MIAVGCGATAIPAVREKSSLRAILQLNTPIDTCEAGVSRAR